jgi:hypothetical protein
VPFSSPTATASEHSQNGRNEGNQGRENRQVENFTEVEKKASLGAKAAKTRVEWTAVERNQTQTKFLHRFVFS